MRGLLALIIQRATIRSPDHSARGRMPQARHGGGSRRWPARLLRARTGSLSAMSVTSTCLELEAHGAQLVDQVLELPTVGAGLALPCVRSGARRCEILGPASEPRKRPESVAVLHRASALSSGPCVESHHACGVRLSRSIIVALGPFLRAPRHPATRPLPGNCQFFRDLPKALRRPETRGA
jgi:hypothetical protein